MHLLRNVKLGAALLILASSLSAHAHNGEVTDKLHTGKSPEQSICESFLEGLVKVSADDFEGYKGLTARGLERVSDAMRALKEVTRSFEANFIGMRSILEMNLLTMATRENALILGPPGGAKSANLTWLIPGMWEKQMHELMTDSALFGGQTENGIKLGTEERNRRDAITESEYGLVDEYPNANPQVSAALLSILNPGERKYTENGKPYVAKLRAIFSTGNATRAQMLKNYSERGLQTGPATLNRSIFKAWVPNWLNSDQLFAYNKIIRKRDHLKSVAAAAESEEEREKAQNALKGLSSQKIDMVALEHFAQHAFYITPDLEVGIQEYAEKFRDEIVKQIRESDALNRKDPRRYPLVFTPSADWTLRFYASLFKVVTRSAALDYLRMHKPEDLKRTSPIKLSPLSLWRVIFATTTIGPGENRFNPATRDIQFNMVANEHGRLASLSPDWMKRGCKDQVELDEWDPLESTCRHASLSIL